ncbi:RluA family pseudouridine synthase [bacterium]|nr:RluA family pseudouridine synthase [bacterium]
MDISILYEDKDIVAVNKPAGIVIHPDGKSKGPFLTDWILENYPKTKNVGEPVETKDFGTIERPGIIHRLDRDTTGVLLIAKTKIGHSALKEQFQERTLTKKYLTFVYGEIKDRFGIINRPIGRSPNDFRRWSATRGARGELRDAETWYTLLAYRAGFSFLEVEPKTGRTHQIRVHFKAVNHPVVCDGLYAPEKILEKPDALGFKRNALHAYSIEFTNCAGKKVMVKAPVPSDFLNAFEELGIQDVAKKEGLC